MTERSKQDRRRFLRNAAVTIATGNLFTTGSADAQTVKLTPGVR